MFVTVIDQMMFVIDLNVNKLKVTLIWQQHTSGWQERIAGAGCAEA